MKFINYLESIAGVGIFPLVSLILFFVFFALVTFYVVNADKKYIERAKNIPLELEQQDI
jgi:hypothetical protein